jgi:molybdopterin/thiamine biosynthesis adenylyltransferase
MNPLAKHPMPDRDLRQRDLVPPKRLAACHAVVIGVGAIGRQVALQLAAVGVARLSLFDRDTVADVNLASQGYRPDQLSLPKTDATGQDCQRINPWIEIVAKAERFRRSTARQIAASRGSLAVFACVDSITTRRLLWGALQEQAVFFVDGRMSAEVIRVLAVATPAADDYYPSTLFDAGQAYAGSCTARSTIYTASIAAGLMVGQFTKWLRHLPVDADVTLNLLAAELTVAGDNVRPH